MSLLSGGLCSLGSAFFPPTAGRQKERIFSFSCSPSSSLPGVGEECKNRQSMLTLPHSQRRLGEVVPCQECIVPPGRTALVGNHSFLQTMGRSQSLPTGCVQHGRGMFPGCKSQNANFQSKNGLR